MVPLVIAGREELIDDVVEGLQNGPGDPNRATIFVGPRGSGKTVLLTTLAERAEGVGWVSANVSARPQMLAECLEGLEYKAAHLLHKGPTSRITSVQAAGVSVSRELEPEASVTWRTQATRLVSELNELGTGVLFTVDEVNAAEPELSLFVDVYQHFVRERRNVAVLLAGLPSRVSDLLLDNDVTFLRRAFQRDLRPIDLDDVASSMLQTIEEGGRTISPEALDVASTQTGGYAFLIQLMGYYLWRQHPARREITTRDAQVALTQARRELERAVFRPTLTELSARERAYVEAMARCGSPSSTADVARLMGITKTNAANVRRRLIDCGIIASHGRGFVEFEIPLLREYVASKADE